MSSKYSKEFALPETFPGALRDLTREVLREQPEDIPTFAYNYFMQKLQQEAAAAAAAEGDAV
ncbi:hypothetical protein M885DRAFT_527335 [Pelagophyceae sp. CCMP2097]|nr:hypothetical protein M885DRAFT_527335 [Pelagophyceae sp. CCMP2097]